MLFDCRPKILHKHCLQFLLGVKMAPRETENNAYAKFWGEKQRTLWYVMVFLEWSIGRMSVGSFSQYRYTTDTLPKLDRQFTDTLPTHYRCYHDRLSVDLSTDRKHHSADIIDRLTIDTRTILDRISTDIAADMSINSQPQYRPMHQSTAPVKHMIR